MFWTHMVGHNLQAVARRLVHHPDHPAATPISLFGYGYTPIMERTDLSPRLFIVVDTEAEFDWSQPFARDMTQVTAMSGIHRGQAIFEEFDLHPIYMVDYPIATQPASFRPLLQLLEAGRCHIGAHTHPWTNPPFQEALSRRNSYPGNLPADLEAAKLACLMHAIKMNFGFRPVFYKAGRYGLGPHSVELMAQHGIRVDFSVLATLDLTYLEGPDFSHLSAIPYRIGDTGIVAVPMTRGFIGRLARLTPNQIWLLQQPLSRAVRLPGVLSRLNLLRPVSLTPEGYTAAQQIKLLEELIRQGHRTLVLSFHSPSLVPGNTPYVRTPEQCDAFLETIRRVCAHFMGQLGGRPGRPNDLLLLAGNASA